MAITAKTKVMAFARNKPYSYKNSKVTPEDILVNIGIKIIDVILHYFYVLKTIDKTQEILDKKKPSSEGL
jgi:hypothetical protein